MPDLPRLEIVGLRRCWAFGDRLDQKALD